MMPRPTPWLLRPPAESTASERIFCFPHAGAGASAFAPWLPQLPDSVDLFRIQLPGRENRLGEEMPDTLEELAAQAAQELLPLLRPPYTLFGHSFGGLLAYALARHLHERGHPLPRTLSISGARPPHLAAPTSYHTLPHDELLGFMQATNGLPEALRKHEEFVRQLLSVLRTDLRIAAEYVPGPAVPLPCDLRIFAALEDPVVQPAVMEGWRDYTAGEFSIHREAGDHHSVYDVSGSLFAAILRSGLGRENTTRRSPSMERPVSTRPSAPHLHHSESAEAVLAQDPDFRGDHFADTRLLTTYLGDCSEATAVGPHTRASQVESAARRARHRFLDRHADRVYAELTAGRSRHVRLDELAFTAADRYPGLVPTRAQLVADRQAHRAAKTCGEVEQGIFFSHLLRQRESGEHLLRSMLAPTPRALGLLPEFSRTGHLDLGQAVIDRDGCVAEVTICNQHVLNAEDNAVVEAVETAVDLALLDDAVSVGVLRGSVLSHPRYSGRRAFGAGINLTHLYEGKIGFVDFMLRRELGYIRKLIHGLQPGSGHGPHDFPSSKPWVGAVDTFAIGGATQITLVLDRVIAGSDAYFSLPALAEGIVPGAANLRLGRVVGRRMAQRLIFFGKQITADSPEGMALCDEVVAPEAISSAVAAAAERLADPAVPSNRRMLHLAEEPDDLFRTYMSRYALEQAVRMHDPDVAEKLERTWVNRRSK